jgi:biotin carboxyl carrier protein
MKMESEIPAPQDGTVKELFVSEGQHVRRGDPLVAIEG